MRPYRFNAGAGIEARSTEDGKLAWWYPDGSARALTDAGVLFTGESDDEVTPDLGLLDTETGEVIWGSDADSWVIEGDVVYVTDQEKLRSLDLSSGEENWSVDDVVSPEGGFESNVAAVEDMVVVGGQDEAVAFASSNGKELWRASLGEARSGPYRATSNLVYLETASGSGADEDGDVRFFDTEGQTGSLPVARTHDNFSSSSFDLADTSYLIDTNTELSTTRASRSSVTIPAG